MKLKISWFSVCLFHVCNTLLFSSIFTDRQYLSFDKQEWDDNVEVATPQQLPHGALSKLLPHRVFFDSR